MLSTIPGMQALVNGDTHISMEIWIPNQLDAWETALESGVVENAGKSLEDNWQATFVIPQYTKDANPGADDARRPHEGRVLQPLRNA